MSESALDRLRREVKEKEVEREVEIFRNILRKRKQNMFN
jgi:hypothetical protein